MADIFIHKGPYSRHRTHINLTTEKTRLANVTCKFVFIHGILMYISIFFLCSSALHFKTNPVIYVMTVQSLKLKTILTQSARKKCTLVFSREISDFKKSESFLLQMSVYVEEDIARSANPI